MPAPDARTIGSGSEVILRRARVDDADGLARLLREVLRERIFFAMSAEELPTSPMVHRARIADASTDPSCCLLVAEAGGEIVGLLEGTRARPARQRHSATLSLMVARAHRRRGVGTGLIRSFVCWARAEAIERLALAVLADNACARALYEREGFLEEGRRVRAVKVAPGRYVDEISMARWIGGGEGLDAETNRRQSG